MKKLIDLPDTVIEKLRKKAFKAKASMKKYMEMVLIKDSNEK